MRMSRAFSLVAIALALSACQTMTPEQRRAADEATCSGYGFKRGTDPFATCLMNLELDRRADARSFRDSQDDFFWGPSIVVVGGSHGGSYHGHHGRH